MGWKRKEVDFEEGGGLVTMIPISIFESLTMFEHLRALGL